jgi:hypothetical protein
MEGTSQFEHRHVKVLPARPSYLSNGCSEAAEKMADLREKVGA